MKKHILDFCHDSANHSFNLRSIAAFLQRVNKEGNLTEANVNKTISWLIEAQKRNDEITDRLYTKFKEQEKHD